MVSLGAWTGAPNGLTNNDGFRLQADGLGVILGPGGASQLTQIGFHFSCRQDDL